MHKSILGDVLPSDWPRRPQWNNRIEARRRGGLLGYFMYFRIKFEYGALGPIVVLGMWEA